jgi:hypothetical protein
MPMEVILKDSFHGHNSCPLSVAPQLKSRDPSDRPTSDVSRYGSSLNFTVACQGESRGRCVDKNTNILVSRFEGFRDVYDLGFMGLDQFLPAAPILTFDKTQKGYRTIFCFLDIIRPHGERKPYKAYPDFSF